MLTGDDLIEAFLYISTNATHHGLVKDPSEWPGVCSYKQSLTEKPAAYPFYHYSAEDNEPRVTYHTLKTTILPQFEGLSKSERTENLKGLLNERTKSLVDKRLSLGLGFLGVEGVKSQDPNASPRNISKSPRPRCYTKDAALRRAHRRRENLKSQAYCEASMRYRLRDLAVKFPEFTHRPPLHRKPRFERFKVIPDDFFKKVA